MIKGLLKGIAEAYIKALKMDKDNEFNTDINFMIRNVINNHSGLRIGSKIHYVPSNKERTTFNSNSKYLPSEHIGIVTKMHITEEPRELSTDKEQANIDTKINIGILQLGIFVPEDNMGYVINLDEFNTYEDDIDFVCKGECNR